MMPVRTARAVMRARLRRPARPVRTARAVMRARLGRPARPVRTARAVTRARLGRPARPVRTARPVMRARPARRPRLLTSPRRPATGQPRPTRNSRQGRESARKGRLMALTIGVDVGGTKVAAGVVDEQGRILEKLKRSTPAASPERTAKVISDAVLELLR